jgi:hypothetical protein
MTFSNVLFAVPFTQPQYQVNKLVSKDPSITDALHVPYVTPSTNAMGSEHVKERSQVATQYIAQYLKQIPDHKRWFSQVPYTLAHEPDNAVINAYFGADETKAIIVTSDMVEAMQMTATRFASTDVNVSNRTYRTKNTPEEVAASGLRYSDVLQTLAKSGTRMPYFPWTDERLGEMRQLHLFDEKIGYHGHVKTIIAFEADAEAAYAKANEPPGFEVITDNPEMYSDDSDDSYLDFHTATKVKKTAAAGLRRRGDDDVPDND